MFGCDLNPVAWFVVKNEMTEVDIEEVKRLLADIEAEVKPQIMPYYACDGPNGEKGKWFRRTGGTEEKLPDSFDIFPCRGRSGSTIATKVRKSFTPSGLSTARVSARVAGTARRSCPRLSLPSKRSPWMHGPTGSVATAGKPSMWNGTRREWLPVLHCSSRPTKRPFAVMDEDGRFACPHCGKQYEDRKARSEGNSITLGKSQE